MEAEKVWLGPQASSFTGLGRAGANGDKEPIEKKGTVEELSHKLSGWQFEGVDQPFKQECQLRREVWIWRKVG